jgi:hypothetical protein
MSPNAARVISVRDGRVQPTGSWLYVWIEVGTGAIVYVGGTGFDPELRAYVHVTNEDPQLGRIRATVPQYDQRDFDVLAFKLPDGIDRPAAKQALIARLVEADEYDGEAGAASGLRDVTDPIIQALRLHRQRT